MKKLLLNDEEVAAALNIQGLGYFYGSEQVLDDVTFRLKSACFTALLGPNGAGKTTLFSLVIGLLKSSQGLIEVCGHNIASSVVTALEQIGIVFQQPTLDLGLTVRQNLHYFSALRGFSRVDAERRINEEIERLGLGDIRNKTVRTLNGGHRRRVEIARALLHQPSLLLLDEPTVGLDVPTRNRIVDYVHSLATERGVSVLWATHLIDEIDVNQDDLIVLHSGKIVAHDTATMVIDNCGVDNLVQAYTQLTSGGHGA